VADPLDDAGRLEGLRRNRLTRIELASIDRLLHPAEADLVVVLGEDVHEAALRQAPMQRHLAALETLDGNARAGRLALDAAPTGLAGAGANTAADALARLGGPRIVGNFVQFHVL